VIEKPKNTCSETDRQTDITRAKQQKKTEKIQGKETERNIHSHYEVSGII
jgi:hypothetical protein